jgi:hypothetical protein
VTTFHHNHTFSNPFPSLSTNKRNGFWSCKEWLMAIVFSKNKTLNPNNHTSRYIYKGMKSKFWLLTSMFLKINLISITTNMIFEDACIKVGASVESFVLPFINLGWVFQNMAWSKIQQGFSLKICACPILENMLGNMPSTYTYKFGPSFYNI